MKPINYAGYEITWVKFSWDAVCLCGLRLYRAKTPERALLKAIQWIDKQ